MLIRKVGDEEEILAKGVLDFKVTGDSIIYSDGRAIYTLSDGKSEQICKAFLARNLNIV